MTADRKAAIDDSVRVIRERAPGHMPAFGIIFGTGLSTLSAAVENAVAIPYAEIPHFARPTVESHAGELILGTIEGQSIVAMRGRFHAYEGHDAGAITHPVRVMRALGAHSLIVSNAAGGLNPLHAVGDIVLIEDHINLMGMNPLAGPNDERLGPRFPDMIAPYSHDLIRRAEKAALAAGIRTHRGVYVAVLGPSLETRAEYRFLRGIGADIVGMSTVPEVIVAVHAGLRVLGLSVVTDACLPDALRPVNIEEIIRTATEAEPRLNTIVRGVLRNG